VTVKEGDKRTARPSRLKQSRRSSGCWIGAVSIVVATTSWIAFVPCATVTSSRAFQRVSARGSARSSPRT